VLSRPGGIALLASVTLMPAKEPSPAFGGKSDTAFVRQLWQALERKNLAGKHAVQVRPYKGVSKVHCAVLASTRDRLKLGSRDGTLIVKRNYRPKDISLQAV